MQSWSCDDDDDDDGNHDDDDDEDNNDIQKHLVWSFPQWYHKISFKNFVNWHLLCKVGETIFKVQTNFRNIINS